MRVTAHTTINKKLQIRTERGCQAVDSVWSHAAWCFVPHTNLMQLKSNGQIGQLLDVTDLWSLLKRSSLRTSPGQIPKCCFPAITFAMEARPIFRRCCWADKSGVWKWASSPSPAWGVAPAPTLTRPPPGGLMPTLLPAFSPSLGWKLWIPFRGHSTWNCPWCQSRVSICPKTLQCHVPSREQGAGKNQPEQVFVSPECALLSVGLCWLSGPEQSVCPSGVPPVPVCHRL